MSSPLIQQGTLNRLRGSVNIPGFPSLNVTAPFLGRGGIRLALEGNSILYIPTMTGAVTSPEPYMLVGCTIHLLKTQALASLYKAQMETEARIGSLTVRPDAATLDPYELTNCGIQSIRELAFDGADAEFAVSIGGYYNINASLFDITF